jgi:hypothetical protein
LAHKKSIIGGGGFNLHYIFIRLERLKSKLAPELQKPGFVVGNGVWERFSILRYALSGLPSSLPLISAGWDSWLPLFQGKY